MPPQPLPPTRDGREWPLIFPFPKPIDFELYSKFLSFYCHYISLSHSDIRHTPLFSLPDFTNLIIFQTFLYPVLKLFKIFNTGYGPISRLDFVKSFTEQQLSIGIPFPWEWEFPLEWGSFPSVWFSSHSYDRFIFVLFALDFYWIPILNGNPSSVEWTIVTCRLLRLSDAQG